LLKKTIQEEFFLFIGIFHSTCDPISLHRLRYSPFAVDNFTGHLFASFNTRVGWRASTRE